MSRVEKSATDAATWLAKERADKGYSVPDFAAHIGVRSGTVYNWENPKTPGRPSEENVDKIADGLGLTTDEVRRGLGFYVAEETGLDDVSDAELIIEAIRRVEQIPGDERVELLAQFPSDAMETLTDLAFGVLRYNTQHQEPAKPSRRRRTG